MVNSKMNFLLSYILYNKFEQILKVILCHEKQEKNKKNKARNGPIIVENKQKDKGKTIGLMLRHNACVLF